MKTSFLDLIAEVQDVVRADGLDRSRALDYAAKAIQEEDESLSWPVARRLADALLPVSGDPRAAA